MTPQHKNCDICQPRVDLRERSRAVQADSAGENTPERETNLDAAPAARAPTDASPLHSAQSVTAGMGTGDIPCSRTDAQGPVVVPSTVMPGNFAGIKWNSCCFQHRKALDKAGIAWITEASPEPETNLDAVPAAKAKSCEVNLLQAASELGNPVRQLTQDGTGNKQTAPPCVETDGPPSRGEGLHIPDCRTRLSEAEIDALEYVVEEGRIASMDDYGVLRSLLCRMRPEWETNADVPTFVKSGNDSPQPFIAAYAVYLNGEYDSSYGPDAIDEALEIAAECNGEVVPLYRTPQTHATPGEGSVPRAYEKSDEKRVLCDTNWEPVAWAILHKDHQYVSLLREHAQAHNVYTDAEIVPLYRSPTLTDEEREAIRFASVVYQQGGREKEAATLRSLLDRLSSGRETPE